LDSVNCPLATDRKDPPTPTAQSVEPAVPEAIEVIRKPDLRATALQVEPL